MTEMTKKERTNMYVKAISKAKKKLSHNHWGEYNELLDAELKAVGYVRKRKMSTKPRQPKAVARVASFVDTLPTNAPTQAV